MMERSFIVGIIALLYLTEISEHLHPDLDVVLDDKARAVNMKHLINQSSLICPINKYCKHGTSIEVGFNATDIPVPSNCVSCSCYFSCIKDGTCCPDALLAYEKMECIDVQLMVSKIVNLQETYFLKATCQNFTDFEPVLLQKCEKQDSLIQPYYSDVTDMNYKNEFCAQCNGENLASLRPWKLDVKCSTKTVLSIQDIVHNCTFVYKPLWFQRAIKCVKADERQRYAFNHCNMTGLWASFDPDINFGCENFHQPYGKFKNVFCYICNPSLLSSKAKALKKIDHCESQASMDGGYLQLEKLCKERGTSDRLHPFKNIYCKMCSFHYSILTDERKSININMITDPPADQTQVDLEITLPKGYNTREGIENILQLLTQIYNPSGVFSSITTERETDAPPKNTTLLIQHYLTMCGYTNICNLSYIGNLPDGIIADYRACPPCDCSDDCVVSRFPCCIDKVLEKNMFSCTEQSSFLNIELTFQVETSSTLVDFDGDQGKSFVTISTCPTNSDPVLIDKCEGSLDFDHIEKIPIVVKKSLTAMKNIFCLECHNYIMDEISVYIKFKCSSYFEGFLLTSLEEIFGAAKEMKCDIAFTLSEDQKCENEAGKKEEDDMISKCNTTGLWKMENPDVRQACEQTDQFGIMNQNLHPYPIVKSLYKNAFCAFCNEPFLLLSDDIASGIMCPDRAGDKIKQLCNTIPSDPWWGRFSNVFCYRCTHDMAEYKANVSNIEFPRQVVTGTNKAVLYRSLFSIKREELEVMNTEVQHPCNEGAFDHKKGKCVNFYCAPDRIIQDGKCVHIFEEASDLSYSLVFSLQMADNESILRKEELEFRPYFLCMAIIENIRERLHIVGIGSPLFHFCHVNTNSCESQTLNLSSNNGINNNKLWIIPNKSSVNIQMALFETETSKLTLYEDTLIDTFDEEYIVNESRFVKYINYDAVRWASGCSQSYEFMFIQSALEQMLELKRVHRCLMVDLLVKDGIIYDSINDILLIHNGSIKITSADFEKFEKDGQIYARICYTALPPGMDTDLYQHSLKRLQKSTMDHAYIIFSSTCTGLSILGLLMTFITYCFFKGLRTVPGKNNMHLSFCLLVAQAGLQYSLNLSGLYDSLQCKITGILIHFFWLATFCAMNVCSFHMYQVFFARSMHVNPTPQQKFRRALQYALYIYFVPFFTVLMVVVSHILQSDFQSIGYGVSICFIDEFYVLIFSFIAPSGIITAINIVFYCLTFYRLRVAPTLRSTNQNRQDLIIYAKLCSITGIMWPLVFVDALLQLSVFSFLATFANAFQGVFIFMSFVCNKRVLGMYKALVAREPDSSALSFPNSTKNTNNSLKSQSGRPVSSLHCSEIQDRTVSSLPSSEIQEQIVSPLPYSDIQDQNVSSLPCSGIQDWIT